MLESLGNTNVVFMVGAQILKSGKYLNINKRDERFKPTKYLNIKEKR